MRIAQLMAAASAIGLYPIFGSALGVVALVIALIALYRIDRLAAELHAAINDQALGIQVVTDKAKALSDETDGG